ncbi:hypothetical protein LCGC14_3082890, partial [marine sediment metagenome]
APGLFSWLEPNATEANARAGKEAFDELGVWPVNQAIQEKITVEILPLYGDNLVGEFDDVRPVDKQIKISEQNATKDIMTIDEQRKKFLNLDPLEDSELGGQIVSMASTTSQEPNPFDEDEEDEETTREEEEERTKFRRYTKRHGDGEDFIPTGQTGTELNTTDDGLYSDSNQFTLQATAAAIETGWTTQTYGAGVYGGGVYNGDDDWCMSVVAFKETNIVITVEPDTQTLSLSLLLPSIVIVEAGVTDITVLPASLALTATLNAPTVVVDKTHEVTALSSTLTLFAPSVIIDVVIEPSVLSLSATLTVNSILVEENITVGLAALTLALTIGQHNVLAPLDTVRMMPFI